jgi:hypothetical protein
MLGTLDIEQPTDSPIHIIWTLSSVWHFLAKQRCEILNKTGGSGSCGDIVGYLGGSTYTEPSPPYKKYNTTLYSTTFIFITEDRA